jgi:hypothetical protein
VVEYPIGHKRRRKEGIPFLVEKFKTNLARKFPAKAKGDTGGKPGSEEVGSDAGQRICRSVRDLSDLKLTASPSQWLSAELSLKTPPAPSTMKRAVIKSLIANRSEIAIRVIRAEAAMNVRTVAICSRSDRLALHWSNTASQLMGESKQPLAALPGPSPRGIEQYPVIDGVASCPLGTTDGPRVDSSDEFP